MPGINEQLADETIGLAIDLKGLERGTKLRIRGLLQKLEKDVVARMRTLELEDKTQTQQYRRMETFIRQVRTAIAASYTGPLPKQLNTDLKQLAGVTQASAAQTMNGVFKAEVATPVLTKKELAVLVDGTTITGGTLGEWWEGQSQKLGNLFASQMRIGLAQGESIPELIKRVRGGATGNKIPMEIDGELELVPEYSGGIMEISRRDAETLVRTAAQEVGNKVMQQVYRDNQDVLRGERWLSTLDERTCPRCMALDGAIWDFNGNPTPESPWQGPKPPIPLHPRCRCVLQPLTKSWSQLIEEASGKKVKVLESKLTEAERASMDGPVSTVRLDHWLARQDEGRQRRALGPARFELYQQGNLRLSQMISAEGETVTVDDLTARRGLVPSGPDAAPPAMPPKRGPEQLPLWSEKGEDGEKGYGWDCHSPCLPFGTPHSPDSWVDAVKNWKSAYGSKETRESNIAEAASKLGISPTELEARIQKMVDAWAAEADAYINVPNSVLPKIISDGRFKNQFETGTTKGLPNLQARASTEEKVLGVAPDADPAARPSYGFMSALPDGQDIDASQYGGTTIRLKRHVLRRSSVTFGDSLDRNDRGSQPLMAASQATAPTTLSFQSTSLSHIWSKLGADPSRFTAAAIRKGLRPYTDYAELQIFGGISLDDIEMVIFKGKSRPKLAKILDEAKIPWKLVGDNQLDDMPLPW